MMNTIYIDVFEKVLFVCDEYIDRKCTPRKVHQVVAWAESCIVNFEEKELREFFMCMEGEIDHIRVMANETDFEYRDIPEIEDREKMLIVIDKIKRTLNFDKKTEKYDPLSWPYSDDVW